MAFYFTRDHEWVSVNATEEDATASVGLTDFAQAQLGDIVRVEPPAPGARLDQGKEAAVIESVKAATELRAPVSGIVIAANPALTGEPALVNSDPEGDGWLYRLTLADTAELDALMDAEAYAAFCRTL